MSSEYRVGQRVLIINDGNESDIVVNGRTYEISQVDPSCAEDMPVCVYGENQRERWILEGTFKVVADEQEPVSFSNPFESINTKSLSHLLDLAGQLVAAYDDCDETTRQMLPFALKIGGIEVKR